jgi:small subunit ribosomal protein S16
MSVKLRLLRKGRKKQPFYYIVAADARAPRDGRFIERIGSYNPTTNPATIDLDIDKGVNWLQNGAQPSETVRAILSYKGVLYKNHLVKGAAKGAFPAEEIEAKFNAWVSEKGGRIQEKRDTLAETKSKAMQEALARETKVKEAREKAILAKNSPLAEEVAEAEARVEAEVEVQAEVTAEVEAPVAEVVEEAAPAVEEAAPVAEEAAPVAEEAAPVAEEAAPAVEQAAPALEEAAPVVEASAEEAAPETPAEDAPKADA